MIAVLSDTTLNVPVVTAVPAASTTEMAMKPVFPEGIAIFAS
jgi:hypothetical protein